MASIAPKLRVGIFSDSPAQPRWLVESLARIATNDFAQICVLSARERRAQPRSTLWDAYGRFDRWLFGGPDPLKALPVDPIVSPSRRLAFAPDDPAWRTRVAALRLDVAVALGDVDDDSLRDLARYGVWRHCFGESQSPPELAAMREVIDDKPVVASGLRVKRGGASRMACQSWSRTVPFSIARSHDRVFGRASEFLERSLKRLHDEGDGWLDQQPATAESEAKMPGVAESMLGIATLGARVARRTVETCFTVGQWSLAYRFSPLEPWDGTLEGFHRLVPPADRFWADPFPISVDGRHYIFFEELPFATNKAHISVVEVDRSGHASEPRRVLERDYHLSYPFLVEDEGRLYMIPETACNRTVEIYRCEEFPLKWKRERVLLDQVNCADSTLHRGGGREERNPRWWMFTNSGTHESGFDDELHIFSSDSLLGDWKPHRRNPVKCDVRSSRPAGRLFQQGDKLYRPGQICAPIYGTGVALHRVTRLTDDEYAEEEDRRIVPCAQRAPRRGQPVLGMHTINRAGDLSVTDAFVRRKRF